MSCTHQKHLRSTGIKEEDLSMSLDDSVTRSESAADVPKEISDILNVITKPGEVGMSAIQSTTADKLTLDSLDYRYGKSSKAPLSLNSVYEGFVKKGISLHAFNKITTDWPKVSTDLHIIIFKRHVEKLTNGRALIENMVPKKNLNTIKLIEETNNHFLFLFKARSESDLKLLGKLLNYSNLNPVAVLPSKKSPLSNFLNVPAAVVESYKKKMTHRTSNSFVSFLKEGRMSINLINVIAGYSGKATLKIKLVINDYNGDKKEVESVVLQKFSKKQVKFLSSSDDTITYDITITSFGDLNNLGLVLNKDLNKGAITI